MGDKVDGLEDAIWRATEMLRGVVDATQYKDILLPLVALKWLSDRADNETPAFAIPPAASWDVIRKAHGRFDDALTCASTLIEEQNAPALDGVLPSTIWTNSEALGSESERNRLIGDLVAHFDAIEFGTDAAASSNAMGDVYELLVERFAGSTKLAGEFYTPRSIARLLAALVDPSEHMSICDPTSGSGGLLLYAARHVADNGGDPGTLSLHGQERNRATRAVGKLNLLLHGFDNIRVEAGDVIGDLRLLDDDGRLTKYDAAVLNPPFSSTWDRESAALDPHKRFTGFGALPPRRRADMAFVLHALAATTETGRVVSVLPFGPLFRGGAEATIRRNLVERDWFDTIIALPPGLFYATGIPVAVCVLNKSKPPQRCGQILFVDASGPDSFRGAKPRNELDPEHIDRIVETARAFADDESYARVVTADEVAANDFNLSVHRYVSAAPPPPPPPDVREALADLLSIEKESDATRKAMYASLSLLGLGVANDVRSVPLHYAVVYEFDDEARVRAYVPDLGGDPVAEGQWPDIAEAAVLATNSAVKGYLDGGVTPPSARLSLDEAFGVFSAGREGVVSGIMVGLVPVSVE